MTPGSLVRYHDRTGDRITSRGLSGRPRSHPGGGHVRGYGRAELHRTPRFCL